MHCISANTLNKAGTLHQDTCTFLLAKGNTIQRILNPRTNAPLTLDISLCVVAAPFIQNLTDSISGARAARAITQSQCGIDRNLRQACPQSRAQGSKLMIPLLHLYTLGKTKTGVRRSSLDFDRSGLLYKLLLALASAVTAVSQPNLGTPEAGQSTTWSATLALQMRPPPPQQGSQPDAVVRGRINSQSFQEHLRCPGHPRGASPHTPSALQRQHADQHGDELTLALQSKPDPCLAGGLSTRAKNNLKGRSR